MERRKQEEAHVKLLQQQQAKVLHDHDDILQHDCVRFLYYEHNHVTQRHLLLLGIYIQQQLGR